MEQLKSSILNFLIYEENLIFFFISAAFSEGKDKIRQETERKVRNVSTKVTATVVKWVYGVDHQLEQPVSKVGPGVEHGDAAVRGPANKNRFMLIS